MGALKTPHRHIATPLGLLQQSGVAHGFFAERGGEGSRGCKGDKAGKHISHEDARPSEAGGAMCMAGRSRTMSPCGRLLADDMPTLMRYSGACPGVAVRMRRGERAKRARPMDLGGVAFSQEPMMQRNP